MDVEEYRWKEYRGNVESINIPAYNAYSINIANDVLLGTLGYATKFLRKVIKEVKKDYHIIPKD
ncbi:hypothetical protein [Neobacillus niacini]|uniref:hypothetical protein n=1 Tax=Neobacillus niacini TaxID=86668 RepID=UPI00286AEB7B|nr:hypothetical protein [Neobacillus niacini]